MEDSGDDNKNNIVVYDSSGDDRDANDIIVVYDSSGDDSGDDDNLPATASASTRIISDVCCATNFMRRIRALDTETS
jgi:hypothetical protein